MEEYGQGREFTGDHQPVPQQTPKKRPGKPKTYRRGILTGVLAACGVFVRLIAIAAFVFLRGFGVGDLLSGGCLGKLATLSSIIDYYFYEDVDTDQLQTGLYKGLLESLDDPYSTYYTADEFEQIMIDTSGEYAGVGMTLTQRTDTNQVFVVQVYEGSPAEQAGLMAGDELISADGYMAQEMDLETFVSHIRGEENSTVDIVYARDGQQQEVTVTRAHVSTPSVSYQMLDGNIGYIEITDFAQNTQEQFEAAMKDLKNQGMQAVIFDLRSNGGGLVDSVTAILDDLLPAGTTVYMEDKHGERTVYSSDDEKQENMPMAVLTSGNTASAAEIFAGAIRDFHYGTLIGTKTFGKGIVQTTIPLPDGSAIKVTTARYYTHSGECINEKGIEPDIELEYQFLGMEDQAYDVSLDNQIQKAVEVLSQEM